LIQIRIWSQADLVVRKATHEAAVHATGSMSVDLLTKIHASWAAMSLLLVVSGGKKAPPAKKKADKESTD
jgi:hypothetical protein